MHATKKSLQWKLDNRLTPWLSHSHTVFPFLKEYYFPAQGNIPVFLPILGCKYFCNTAYDISVFKKDVLG